VLHNHKQQVKIYF